MVLIPVDRRRLIIEAAAKAFSLFGYKATTMEHVAKVANVGKGTIYTFFSHKEELFWDVMGSFILEMKAVAEDTLDPEQPFFTNLHHILIAMLKFRESHELSFRLSHEMKDFGTPMAREGMLEIEKAIVAFIRKQIEAALQKGDIKACDPELTAFVMLRLYIAFVYDWEQTHGRLGNDEIMKLFELYLRDGLAAK